MSSHDHEHVRVAVEAGSRDEEEIGVLPLGEGIYRVVVPPLYTYGLGVGDEFRVDAETRRPEVVRRSGNLRARKRSSRVSPGSAARTRAWRTTGAFSCSRFP